MAEKNQATFTSESIIMRSRYTCRRFIMCFLGYIAYILLGLLVIWLLFDIIQPLSVLFVKFLHFILLGDVPYIGVFNRTVFYVILFIVNILLAVAFFVFPVLNIIWVIVSKVTHKDIFYTEKGVYIGTPRKIDQFVEWSQITAIDCGTGSSTERYGHIIVYTKIPKKNGKMRKFYLGEIKCPGEMCNKGMRYMLDYRYKKREAL